MKKYLWFNGIVITMNKTKDVINDGAIYVEGNHIEKVGKKEKIFESCDLAGVEKIDAKGNVIMPGLICNHTHVFQSLYKGLAENHSLLDWVSNSVMPMSLYLDEEKTYTASMLAIAELLRTGTTCFVDSHYIHKDNNSIAGVAKAIENTGIRGMLCRGSVETPFSGAAPVLFEDVSTAEHGAIECIKKYHNTINGRCRVAIEALGTGICSDEMIKNTFQSC